VGAKKIPDFVFAGSACAQLQRATTKEDSMTQRQFEREVASATGESVDTIRRRGFSPCEPEFPEPLVVDWDELEIQRVGVFPAYFPPSRAA
jgi:hypothetical protein